MTLGKTCILHARKINLQIKPNVSSIPLSPGVTGLSHPRSLRTLGTQGWTERAEAAGEGVPKRSLA